MAVLTEEQRIIKDQVSSWVRDEAPVAKFREMRDSAPEFAFQTTTWESICNLGWTGMLIPEPYGGSGMDFKTLGLVLEELGRGLTASPLVASGVVGASALLLGGSEEQKRQWLPRIATGEVIATLAVDELAHHQAVSPSMSFTSTSSNFIGRVCSDAIEQVITDGDYEQGYLDVRELQRDVEDSGARFDRIVDVHVTSSALRTEERSRG